MYNVIFFGNPRFKVDYFNGVHCSVIQQWVWKAYASFIVWFSLGLVSYPIVGFAEQHTNLDTNLLKIRKKEGDTCMGIT